MKESTKKKGCCHSENIVYKVDDSHNFVKASTDFSKTIIAAPVIFIQLEQPLLQANKTLALQYHSPPDNRSTSVYLYNSVFRI